MVKKLKMKLSKTIFVRYPLHVDSQSDLKFQRKKTDFPITVA